MKKHLYISITLLHFAFFTLLANGNIPFDQLTFTSELERNSFNSTSNNAVSPIQMLSTVNPSTNQKDITDITQHLEEIYNYLEQKNIRKKQPFKAATLIHRTFHQKLFSNFQKYSYFNEVFSNGNYNCVTATAILALTFERFDLPYSIQEQRKHVFIIVKDEENDIMVESTDAQNGVYFIDKKTIVEEWKSFNLIELHQNSIINYDSLFRVRSKMDLYHIGFKELTANLYTNSAILMQKNKFYEEAEQMMRKSLYLYNDRDEKFRNTISINHLILTIDVNQLETLAPLLKLIENETTSKMGQNELIGLFEAATKYLLLEKNDFDTHTKLSFYLKKHLESTTYKELFQQMNYINSYYKNISMN